MPNRRRFLLAFSLLVLAPWAGAGGLDAVTGGEAGQALRDSLDKSARAALARLGKENGYFADPKVKIALPKNFRKADRILRGLGQGRKVDDLILAMNRAAEAAAPQAQALFVEAVAKIAVTDAKTILAAGDDAATQYFRKVSEARLSEQLLPIIRSVSEKSDMTRAYDALAKTLFSLAGIKSEMATVEAYVNERALAGIFVRMAEEERALRADPGQSAGSPMGKVFGLLK